MGQVEISPQEEKALTLLHQRRADLGELQVQEHTVKFDVHEWRRWFGGTFFERDEAVEVFEDEGALSRGELFQLAEHAAESGYGAPEVKKLWLAVYAWGGGVGATGYRARVNARLAFFDTRFDESIRLTIERLSRNDLAGAHRAIDPVIGAGEGFFTKFLYFISKPGSVNPLPLIYDEQMRRALQALLGKKWALPLGATMTTSAAEIYELYVRTMHRWAGELRCSPEQLELYLFKTRGAVRV